MIVKIVGVSTEAVSRLHSAVSQIESGFISVQESKFDSQHKTYSVSLKVKPQSLEKCSVSSSDASGEIEGEQHVYHSSKKLLGVLRAIDSELFPPEETHLPTVETLKKLRKHDRIHEREELEKELVERTRALRGQTTQTDICVKGRIVLPAGATYTTQNNELCFEQEAISDLELPKESEDPFVFELRLIQSIIEKIKELVTEIAKM